MYDIITKSKQVEKDFDKLVKSLSVENQHKLMTTLARNPKPTPSNNSELNKPEKRGKFWQYEPTKGERVIYDVLERPKTVIIQFAGNHDKANLFKRTHG